MPSIEAIMSDKHLFVEEYVFSGCNAAAMARRLGCPEKERTFQRRAMECIDFIPDHFQSEVFDELTVEGDGVVAFDWHIPLTNYELVMRMLERADKEGLTAYCAIPGDFMNQDAFSEYDPKQSDAGADLEMRMTNKTMDCVLDVFDVVALALGNHDVRAAKKLGYKLRFDRLMDMILHRVHPAKKEKLRVVGNDHINIETESGPWRACHTASYSKTPLAVPRELCDIYLCHVVAGHRHHAATGYSKGGFMAVEGGGLFDASKTAYLRRWSTTFPRWQNDWVELRNGRPTLPIMSGFIPGY